MTTRTERSPLIAKAAWGFGAIIFAMGFFAVLGAVLHYDKQSEIALPVGLIGLISGLCLLVGGSILDRLSRIADHLRPASSGPAQIQRSAMDAFKGRMEVYRMNSWYLFKQLVEVFSVRNS